MVTWVVHNLSLDPCSDFYVSFDIVHAPRLHGAHFSDPVCSSFCSFVSASLFVSVSVMMSTGAHTRFTIEQFGSLKW